MLKVYQLNQKRNNSAFILYGKGGNAVQYMFKGGNVVTSTPATFITSNEYYQNLLEESELFKKGVVKLDPKCAMEEAQLKAMEAKAKAEWEAKLAAMEQVEDVKTVAQAIAFVAERFGEVAKTAKQAKEIAEKNGVNLVNLKVGK